jgi:vitamin B12 transporter
MQGANDLSDVLKHEGLWMEDTGASKNVQIRGMSAGSMENTQLQSRVLILVNGRRTGAVQVSQVPVNNVDRIEIIRGPGAVQYGSSALGGVVNVITKKGEKDSFHLVIEEGVGSSNLYKSHVGLNGEYQNFDFSIAYDYLERGNLHMKGGEEFPHTSQLHKSVSVETGYTFMEKHRIGFSYAYSKFRDEWPGVGYRDYLDIISQGGNIDFNYGIYTPTITTVGFTYDGATENDMFDWAAFFSKSRYRRPSINYPSWSVPPPGGDFNFTNQDITNAGASIGYNSKHLDIDLGFDIVKYKINGMWDGEFKSDDLGFYISSKIKLLNDTLFFNLGARYDHFKFETVDSAYPSRTKNAFNPAFGIAYLPLDWLKLRANYSQGIKMPTSIQYAGSTQQANQYFPNPGLQPEESQTYEFGVDVDWRFITASFTYFHTNFKNMITTAPYPYAAGAWYINLDKTELSGIELSMGADLGAAFDLGFVLRPHFSYTHMLKAKNKDATRRLEDGSDDLAFVPRWSLAWGVSFDHRGLDLSADLTAVHFGRIINNYTYPTSRTFATSPGLATVDLAIEKGIFEIGSNGNMGKVKLRVQVQNLFDNDNEIYYDYRGPGRSFYVGVKYEY